MFCQCTLLLLIYFQQIKYLISVFIDGINVLPPTKIPLQLMEVTRPALKLKPSS